MLDKIKILNDISNDSLDNKLKIYIDIAKDLIKNYLNKDDLDNEVLENKYESAIIVIVSNAYQCKKKGNIKSMTQGSRSVTYIDDTAFCINKDIADMLPAPYVNMFH